MLAEDSAELRPDHPHVVRLEGRPANQEGVGLVELQDLVRQALRMRPDRLVVGEVRGPEVVSLLAALNTGHEGGCGTLHANAAGQVPARLEALGTAAGLDRAALHSQLAAALSVVLHLVRDPDGRRRIAEVHVLERDGSGLVVTVPALRWGKEAFVYERGWEQLRGLLRDGLRGRGGGVVDGLQGRGDALRGRSAGGGPVGPQDTELVGSGRPAARLGEGFARETDGLDGLEGGRQ